MEGNEVPEINFEFIPTISHAYIENLEPDGMARLELRLTATNETCEEGKKRRLPTKMVEIPTEELMAVLPESKPMDVIVVEHKGGEILKICYIDRDETQRRRDRAQRLKEMLSAKMHMGKTE